MALKMRSIYVRQTENKQVISSDACHNLHFRPPRAFRSFCLDLCPFVGSKWGSSCLKPCTRCMFYGGGLRNYHWLRVEDAASFIYNPRCTLVVLHLWLVGKWILSPICNVMQIIRSQWISAANTAALIQREQHWSATEHFNSLYNTHSDLTLDCVKLFSS